LSAIVWQNGLMSLHRILSLFVIVLAALALGAAVSLAWLTTSLHRTTVELEAALQSVRLTEGMQIDLLSYIRTHDAFFRSGLEADLRDKLYESREFVSEPEEQAMLAEAQQLIEDHFAHQDRSAVEVNDGDLQAAFSTLRRFMEFNIQQANASMRVSERWDEIGDRVSIGFTAILIAGMTAVLVWLRRVAFEPVFEIQAAIRDFAAGRKETRAPEHGPEELKIIARQFNEMAASLARQYDRQLSFLAAVAHDLRNPIGALKTSTNVLSTDRKLPPETVSHIMSIVARQVNGLDRMIGDLLDQSRIEAGDLELRIQEGDIRPVAQDAFDLFSTSAKHHRLKLDLPDTPVAARFDPLRIQQVLNNLISNAIKYSPPGTGVDMGVEELDGELVVRVSDHGMGIPEAELPFIFEPFRRTSAARDDVPGVGLGLSVAQRIVRAHGGRIQVESEVGKGTTFRVYLPALKANARKLTA
jgi:two-component system, OmpR family, sensor histidine kinase MtrB